MAYTNDLVRLAVSAHLAVETGHLPFEPKDLCDAMLEGYREGMSKGGEPFVLGERHQWLRLMAESELREPVHFWAKMDAYPTVKGEVPVSALDALEHLLPVREIEFRLAHRVAGLGSLGHARYVAIATWKGGRIAREAKALVSSACYWATECDGPPEILYQAIVGRAVRCLDPFVQLRGHWIVRRLSPHCSRIELSDVKAQVKELRLLHAMGWETANIHLGTRNARKSILRHLDRQKSRWLHKATQVMLDAVRDDWKTWKNEGYD